MQPLHPSRRRFLRGVLGGAAVGVGLPWLEFMAHPAKAHAAGADAFPRRFVLFFWGNGMLPDRWVPTGTGADYTLSEQLEPLASIREHLTVVSGMAVKTPNIGAHSSGPAGFLAGGPLRQDGTNMVMPGPTIDQIIANEVGGNTVFRSLEIAVEDGARGLSHTSPTSVNPAESNPRVLFERLFGGSFRAPGEEPIVDPTLSLRRSVLDAVSDNVRRLQNRVGTADKARLDQHFSAVRDLELRVARLLEDPPNLAACSRPQEPGDYLPIDGRPQMSALTAVMADMAAMSLACDQTRVLSLWYSSPVNNILYPGAYAGHHGLTHDEPGDQPTVNMIVRSIMGDFATFVQRLAAVDEGDGTLLDHTGILATSDVSQGRNHSIDEYPVLLAGKMGGYLKPGQHYRSGSGASVSKVALTMAQGMGLSLPSFGYDAGETDAVVSEVLA